MRGRGVEHGDDLVVSDEAADGIAVLPTAIAVETILAVDLGLRCGLAWWVRDGAGDVRLARHRCTEFHSRARLKAAVSGVLAEVPGLVTVVGEGDRALWEIWTKAAFARRVSVRWVSPELWRRGLWGSDFGSDGAEAKARARLLAEGSGEKARGTGDMAELEAVGLVGRFGVRAATRMRTDAAEAVCLGFWAIGERGWR